MDKIMVIGAGYMGSGIAQVCANGGYNVLLCDLNKELAQKGKEKIETGLKKQIIRGKMTQKQVERLLSRISVTAELEHSAEADLVIEAIIENVQAKCKLLSEVEHYCRDETFLATNTSYIPITKLSECLKKPERFLGMHFFAPVYSMKLLEIIRGKKTSDKAVKMALKVASVIGKDPIVVNKDSPGFVVNRINQAMRVEAFRVMHEGIASLEDIDKAIKLGLNHPMGPFELSDMGGLDTTYRCLEVLYELTGDERWVPIPELKEHVEKGEFGRKTGKGWYDYTK
jgi:3-hydroxybutyryl-CoA dehydrogenase